MIWGLNSFAQVDPEQTLGQPPVDSITERQGADLAQYLPPLSILIDSAIANSTQVKLAEIQIKMREYEVSQNKKDWSDLVSFSGQYRYTDITGLAVTEDGLPVQSQSSAGFYLGAGVRVPLSYLTQKKDRMEMAKLNVDVMETQYEAARKMVREEVINTYNELLLLQKLINISSEARESTDIIYQMSEERFRDGELGLEQMGSNTGLKAKYASEYEQMKTQFSNTYSRLERLVGVPLSKLEY